MPMSSKAFLEATRARQAEEAQAARMARYDAHMKQQRAKKRLRNEMRDALDTHNKTLAGRARKSAARLAANPRTGGAAPRTADDETIKKAFAHFDKDGSGTIDVQELGGALQMVLGRRPAKEAIQKLFEIADEDGSGELDLREWTKVAKRGELVDKEILHPKYRLMMEIKRRRAGQRDASEAALAATLKVWDVETGKCVATLEGHTFWVECVAISPDGRHIVSASCDNDNTLKVWDVATGECLATLKGHKSDVESVAVFPDGRRVVSVSGDDLKLFAC